MKRERRRSVRAVVKDGGAAATSPAWRHALMLAGLLGFTLLVYSNTLSAPFLLDNHEVIVQDPRIREATFENLRQIFTQQYSALKESFLYRPFTTSSYLFNYAILGDGERPAGYHWFNLILHGINMALVCALGLAVFQRFGAAFLLAALWGLHPVLTESVTNIVGRADMLAVFGVLAALLCHRQALRVPGGARQALWLAAMAMAVTIGAFSKESGIVVVAVIALYDLTFGRAVSWRARVPGYVAAVVPCLVLLWARAQVLAGLSQPAFPFVENPLVGAGFWTARVTAIKIIGKYFGLLVWPATLSCNYSYNEIPLFGWGLGAWEDWKAALALLGCAAAIVVAVLSYRRHKPVFFFMAFFFVTLLPTSNLVVLIGSIMGERFLCLPSLGFAGCVVYAADALWRRLPAGRPALRYAAGAAVAVILIACGARAYARNQDWLDPQRFWRSALEAAPGSFFVHTGVAVNSSYLTPEDWDRSIRETGRALEIIDGLPDRHNSGFAYFNAGILYRGAGDRLAAHQSAGAAAAGTSAEYWYRKALQAFLRAERIDLAKGELSRRENAPRGKSPIRFVTGNLYLQLGRSHMRLNDPRSALEAFQRGRALAADPDLMEEMGSAYRATGDLRQAALALVEAVSVDSSRTRLIATLVELYRQIDPHGCAVGVQGGAPSLNVNCPLVRGDICTASGNVSATYQREGHAAEAATIRRIAAQEFGCPPE